MSVRVARSVIVSGRVQGVAYRWYAREAAFELGVDGWVRNLPDGRVEVHLEGEPAAVESMVERLRAGSPAARVRGIEASDASAAGLRGFEVRR